MSASDSWKLLVFRDGKRVCNGRELLRALVAQIEYVLSIRDFTLQAARDELIEGLLRAGELECGLADHEDCGREARVVSELSDELAHTLVSARPQGTLSAFLSSLTPLNVPERLTLSPPEGFCYYALHPLDVADLFDESKIHLPAAAVLGIRSIGTTLSAVATAWFRSRDIPAERITVRPNGHPFNRKLSLTDEQREWVRKNANVGAAFFIVDEGPGLSGSSFLAVAEALVEADVDAGKITLIPSSEPDLGKLFAPNAPERWKRYKTLPLRPTRHIPAQAVQDVGWGTWRSRVYASESEWPAVWAWTERRKYLSADGFNLFRFDGHGHYGKTVRHRSASLAEHGWGPQVASSGEGFSVSPWLEGNRPNRADRSLVIQLAQYCAFRAANFACEPASASPLQEMAQINLERTLGASVTLHLPIERAVLADARMMPHEWLHTHDGRLLKFDAASHGDAHFYPGPTDIAWDVAGIIAEWKLTGDAKDFFVSEYRRLTGDKIDERLRAYFIAYCAFRMAFTLSAGQSIGDQAERQRFEREAANYRARLVSVLRLSNAA